jgi:hypothetical protein
VIIFANSFKHLIFVMVTFCGLFEVRTESLNIIQTSFGFQRVNQQICSSFFGWPEFDCGNSRISLFATTGAWAAQSVQCLTTGSTIGVQCPAEVKYFFLASVSTPALRTVQSPVAMSIDGKFPVVKRGSDAD